MDSFELLVKDADIKRITILRQTEEKVVYWFSKLHASYRYPTTVYKMRPFPSTATFFGHNYYK